MKSLNLSLTQDEMAQLVREKFVRIDDEERGEICVSLKSTFNDPRKTADDGTLLRGRELIVKVVRAGTAATQGGDGD